MASLAPAFDDPEWTLVPRQLIRLPLEYPIPPGFDPARPGTWPEVPGRLEYVQGRLVFMPPCGDEQQQTATDLAATLVAWQRKHARFRVGGNEAGMKLGGDVRAADGVVWRTADLGRLTGGFPRVPPVLAVEVAGRDDTVEALVEKAWWYLDRGVEVVWILEPRSRTVRVLDREGTHEYGTGERLPAHPSLPGLTPPVKDLFRQVSARSGRARRR